MGCPRCNAADTVTLAGDRWACVCGWSQPATPWITYRSAATQAATFSGYEAPADSTGNCEERR